MFRRIKPRRMSDEVYEQLRELIISGLLKPGDKLPPERELAEKMGVSRPVVREAISRLVAKGYLENVQGSGTYVCSVAQSCLEESPAHDFLKSGSKAMLQIVEVRKILETWSAALAAERATQQELNQMREYLKEFETSVKKDELAHTVDANFHLSISYATHNTFLIHLMDSIYSLIERVTYEIGHKVRWSSEDYWELYRQHHAIYKAIENRDPEMAYLKMMEHMIYVERQIKRALVEKRVESFLSF